MEADFFKDLEESISNVGTEEVWKKTIGSRVIWFSPIPFLGQAKVQEALSSKDLGTNIINETKRITLSHTIVGIDQYDLREFRYAGPVFGPIDVGGGKKFKVDLPNYIYTKMGAWGSQFIDDAFAVFADLMESHGKANLKEVKFENAKHPMEELGDLMLRVTELRIQLGLPELIEKGDGNPDESAEFKRSILDDAPIEDETPNVSEPEDAPFDPFQTVRVDEKRPSPQQSRPIPQPSAPPAPPQIFEPPVPVHTVPVALPPQSARRAQSIADLEDFTPVSTPQSPFVASSSSDVIEPKERPSQVAPPVIDPIKYGTNPRFNPTKY